MEDDGRLTQKHQLGKKKNVQTYLNHDDMRGTLVTGRRDLREAPMQKPVSQKLLNFRRLIVLGHSLELKLILPLGIENGIGRAKEGIGSKELMKRRQRKENRAPCDRTAHRATARVPGSITEMSLLNHERPYEAKQMLTFSLIVRPHG
ncbi:hypothetical protein PIB30_048768 [Stylosanthes scabra]|uniref:Uncharacterized protein n=1 Tax=Stylosanthes scabra TaxID=79078 RepID=A0ABU6THY6_9FABA|nr:hypothetical protein [Stylosanthes scabra]